MAAPTVEAAIHELMDFCWNVFYDLLDGRGLLGDGLFVEEYTGIHSWLEDLTRYTVVHSRTVAVFLWTRGRWMPSCSTTTFWAQTLRKATSASLGSGLKENPVLRAAFEEDLSSGATVMASQLVGRLGLFVTGTLR